jgi:hypothetical protein
MQADTSLQGDYKVLTLPSTPEDTVHWPVPPPPPPKTCAYTKTSVKLTPSNSHRNLPQATIDDQQKKMPCHHEIFSSCSVQGNENHEHRHTVLLPPKVSADHLAVSVALLLYFTKKFNSSSSWNLRIVAKVICRKVPDVSDAWRAGSAWRQLLATRMRVNLGNIKSGVYHREKKKKTAHKKYTAVQQIFKACISSTAGPLFPALTHSTATIPFPKYLAGGSGTLVQLLLP